MFLDFYKNYIDQSIWLQITNNNETLTIILLLFIINNKTISNNNNNDSIYSGGSIVQSKELELKRDVIYLTHNRQ